MSLKSGLMSPYFLITLLLLRIKASSEKFVHIFRPIKVEKLLILSFFAFKSKRKVGQ